MPSRRRSSSSRFIFRGRDAVVQEADSTRPGCQCSLTIMFNEAKSQGSINLRLSAGFDGFDNEQHVTLRLSAENLKHLHSCFDAERIPGFLNDHLIKNPLFSSPDKVLILSLDMNAPGCLLVPANTTTLVPKDEFRIQVQNFQRLCQTTKLVLYIPGFDLSDSQQHALHSFTNMVASGTLTSLPAFSGHAAQVTTWEVFDIREPPPSYARPPQQAPRKRAREASPNYADLDDKRVAVGSSSSTDRHAADVATAHGLLPSNPATVPLPTSLPTISLRDSVLVNALRGIIEDVLREVLSETVRLELEKMVLPMVRDMLPTIVKEVLPAVLASTSDASQPFRGPLSPIVRDHLPQVVEDYVDENELCDGVLDSAGLCVQEWVQDAVVDVQEAKEECVKEIEDLEQRTVDKMLEMEREATERLEATICRLEERAEELAGERLAQQTAEPTSQPSIPDAQPAEAPPYPPSSLGAATTESESEIDLDERAGKQSASLIRSRFSTENTGAEAELESPPSQVQAANYPTWSDRPLLGGPMDIDPGSTTEPDTESSSAQSTVDS